MTLSLIETIDYHTAGEPLRIVTAGLPDIPGDSMLEKRRYMSEHLDHWRTFLMLEPRGHADMYGAVLTDPVTDDGDTGVLFLHNEGYSSMCGHGIIALVRAGIEHELFSIADPRNIRIDTPAGRIVAAVNEDMDGCSNAVSFQNVPSFVLEDRLAVSIDNRSVETCIAYGGAFYAYVEAADFDLQLVPEEAETLIALGRRIKKAVSDVYTVCHPLGHEELNFLYGVIFVKPGEKTGESRNVCIFADGELDRSPTGTGVSGRAAIHWSRGELALGEPLNIESIIGTGFSVSCNKETRVGELPAVITEVSGSAVYTGRHQFGLDPNDPLPQGFLIR